MRCSGLVRGFGAAVLMAAAGCRATAAQACGAIYTVERGDHLGRIAKECGVSANSLLKVNNLRDPSMLRIGQELQIPGGDAPKSEVQAGTAADASDLDELKGQIINGRYCAQIVTQDGTRYGLVSPKLAFTSGKVVTVRGSMHKYSGCSPDKTMLVSTILEDGVDATEVSATVEAANFTN
ncbi:MAG: LysM domain-containing protein [Pseudomonadota bacterium]